MPVTTPHPQYLHYQPDWQKCRDAADGDRAIKNRGELYLPKLSEQDNPEYDAYRKRAVWYGATGRTVQGLAGSVFRKPPTVEVPEGMAPHLRDITMTGVSLESFCKTMMAEILKVGRYGVLVDMGKDAEAVARPYWVGYRAEQIVNWATKQVAGDTVLTMVVLQEEHIEIDPQDPFSYVTHPQYRVLLIRDGRYVVEIWRQTDREKEAWGVADTLTPLMRGEPLTFIPFCFVGPTHMTPDIDKPPLLDLVEVNLAHYRNSADHEHGIHYTALPTPWVAGFPTDRVLRVGPSVAWVSNDPNANAGMLEFTGDGLGTLERAMDRKERQMAILGARLLEEDKRAVEAAESRRIRGAGEQSALASMAGTGEAVTLTLLRWHLQWIGGQPDDVEAEFNKDFYEARMDPTEMAELMKAWQSGAISHATLYWNLQRGEITRPGITLEDEQEEIEQQPPASLPLAPPGPEGFGEPGGFPGDQP